MIATLQPFACVWTVGSELQFTTSFPLDCLDPAPCRNLVFRLHETLIFENHVKALSLRPKYQVLGTKYLVPSTWYQVLGTKYLVLKALSLRP